ncbi:MAG: ABC transporter ATP-binding protein [Clostridia bacterium]|nr:ABC transporter ATP-binding protein [Clostridia bacterium]
MSFLEISNLTAGYGGKPVIEDVSFTVESGCVMGILGANGSGKTTLLKSVCGILPHSGSCSVNGIRLEELAPKRLGRSCSYIPQRSGISIDISAIDVVLMGFNPKLGLLEHPGESMKNQARQALAEVGLAGREEDNYLHLSEGQKQLCILARTLISDAELLLLDEPESALDFRYRGRVLDILRNRVRDGAALVTLHDPNLALNRCDRLLLLGGGKILSVLDPANDPTDRMETALSAIYGPVSLCRCRDKQGREQLVMLREDV